MYIGMDISVYRFEKFDKDHSGKISVDEFKEMCHELGYLLSPAEMDMDVKLLDTNGDGKIGYEECKYRYIRADGCVAHRLLLPISCVGSQPRAIRRCPWEHDHQAHTHTLFFDILAKKNP